VAPDAAAAGDGAAAWDGVAVGGGAAAGDGATVGDGASAPAEADAPPVPAGSGLRGASSVVPLAGRRAPNHAVNPFGCSSRSCCRAANTLRSASRSFTTAPPCFSNASSACRVFLPWDQAALRRMNSRLRSPESSSPDSVTAARSRYRAATALSFRTARNDQCTSSSVFASTVRRSRACSAGFRPGSGSTEKAPVAAFSSAHAARPARSSAGRTTSTFFSSRTPETSTSRTNWSNRRSSSDPGGGEGG